MDQSGNYLGLINPEGGQIKRKNCLYVNIFQIGEEGGLTRYDSTDINALKRTTNYFVLLKILLKYWYF